MRTKATVVLVLALFMAGSTAFAQALEPEISGDLEMEEGYSFTYGITASGHVRANGIPIFASSNHPGFCESGAEHLCLLVTPEFPSGRFRVSVSWIVSKESSGEAKVIEFTEGSTSASGLGYFFEFNNQEIFLKLLNACVPPFNRVWFFAAGLTDVEVFLVVQDAKTGEVNIYHNPQGQAFLPIQDTEAFGCDADLALP